MGASPASTDMSPVAEAFCSTQSKLNIYSVNQNNNPQKMMSLGTHTLWTIGFSKNKLSRGKMQSSESNISEGYRDI